MMRATIGIRWSVWSFVAVVLGGWLPAEASARRQDGEPGAPTVARAQPNGETSIASRVIRASDPASETAGGPTAETKLGSTDATNDAVAAWLTETTSQTRGRRDILRRRGAIPSTASADTTAAAGTTGMGVLRLVSPLLAVLAIITVLAVAFRKWLFRSNRLGGGGVINVLTRHHLSPKQSLCLVQLGRRVLLVGVTPDRINAVAEIHDPEEASMILSAVARKRPGSFSSVLSRFGERDPGEETAGGAIEGDATLARERLAATGANVRDLIRRIRTLAVPSMGASGSATSAEPT